MELGFLTREAGNEESKELCPEPDPELEEVREWQKETLRPRMQGGW